MYRSSKKKVRALKELRSDVQRDINKFPSCPYCGGKMILRSGKDIEKKNSEYYDWFKGKSMNSEYRDQEYLVCEEYPRCDCYCRINRKGGAIRLVSTPANRELRLLRSETHFWMNKLVEVGVCDNSKQVYQMVSPSLPISLGRLVHVGECKDTLCKQISEACINILYANKDKFERFEGWRGGNWKSDELFKKVAEISYLKKGEKGN